MPKYKNRSKLYDELRDQGKTIELLRNELEELRGVKVYHEFHEGEINLVINRTDFFDLVMKNLHSMWSYMDDCYYGKLMEKWLELKDLMQEFLPLWKSRDDFERKWAWDTNYFKMKKLDKEEIQPGMYYTFNYNHE